MIFPSLLYLWSFCGWVFWVRKAVFLPKVSALEDIFATDGLWNSSQESHWTAPGPQGFLELVQQWPPINSNMLFMNSEWIVLSSKHWLAIASCVTPANPNEISKGEREEFLSQFYFALGHAWNHTKSWFGDWNSVLWVLAQPHLYKITKYSFANRFLLECFRAINRV